VVNIGVLDWALVGGVAVLGLVLALHFKKKYGVRKRDFTIGSFYVAGLTAIIIAVYHILRGLLLLSP
jgi:hypothetical protein